MHEHHSLIGGTVLSDSYEVSDKVCLLIQSEKRIIRDHGRERNQNSRRQGCLPETMAKEFHLSEEEASGLYKTLYKILEEERTQTI